MTARNGSVALARRGTTLRKNMLANENDECEDAMRLRKEIQEMQ